MISATQLPISNNKNLISASLILAALILPFSIHYIDNPFKNHQYYGHEIGVPAPAFHLKNLENESVLLKDFHGKYVYLMFGYLNCTDTCHSQALILDNLSNQIPDTDVHYVYISMDPDRDDSEKLKYYFKEKNTTISILSGENIQQIQKIANQFNVPFSIKPTETSYEISHPGYLFMINTEGQLSLVYTTKMLDTDRLYKDLLLHKSNLS